MWKIKQNLSIADVSNFIYQEVSIEKLKKPPIN